VSESTTRYYWYPGDKAEWLRAAIAVGVGALTFATVALTTDSALAAVIAGTSMTAAIAGCNLGRRDARALTALPEPSARGARWAAIAHTGRAAWRGVVEGVGAASAAVVIVNLPADGLLGNWLLPIVPAAVGALAHQGGMLWERLARASEVLANSRPVGAEKPAMAPEPVTGQPAVLG
jgi:hypothetical protein